MLDVDIHIHSVHSGHAYGTFYEIVEEAVKKKMKLIAITDHGPALPGTIGGINHFLMGQRAPKVVGGVRILWGCEANIINENGEIDLDERAQKRLDFVMVGFHKYAGYNDLGKEKNTEAIIKALKNPYVKILVHPPRKIFDYDREKVYGTAIENDILLELNLGSLGEGHENIEEERKMIDFVRKNGKKLIVGSDAHFLGEIGNDENLKKYWDELGLTEDIIINNDLKELMNFLDVE